MSEYTQATVFTAKDSLSVNDPDKKVVGSELDAEFVAIATAIASKLDATEVGGANGVAELDAHSKVPPTQAWAEHSATSIVSSAIALDTATANQFYVILTENITVSAPADPQDGQAIWIILKQDGTGSRTVTWNAVWCFPGGSAPTMTATAGKADLYHAVYNATLAKWLVVANQNYTVA